MSEEGQEPTTTDVEPTESPEPTEQQPTTAAGSIDELPDWAQKLVKDMRSENAKHRKEKTAAQKAVEEHERQVAEEQGKYKELYQDTQSKLAELEQRATAAELARLRSDVAHKHNLPAELAKRLQGETEEEIEADAKVLLDAIPKPTPQTSTDGANGINQSQPTPEMTDAEIQEMAAKYGVSAAHLKQTLEKQARTK